MMKVLHIINDMKTGGAQMCLYRLLATMDRERFDPTVVALLKTGTLGSRITSLGIPVYFLGSSMPHIVFGSFLKLPQILHAVQPTVIQGWMYHSNVAALLAQLYTLRSASVIWNVRHTPYELEDEKRITAMLIRLGAPLSGQPNRIVYNSVTSARRHETLGYRKNRRTIIPNGFDLTRYKPDSEARYSVRDELGLAPDTPLIGLIARFHPMKGHDVFLSAAARILHTHPDVRFLLAGPGVDGTNVTIKTLVQREQVNSHVFLLGERRDIPRLTAALDIATSASTWGEGFPNVVGEAMASGIPCVVTDIGDSARLIEGTGIVIPPDDPSALADAWRRLLTLDARERRRLGASARNRVRTHFSIDSMTQAYEQLYTETVERCVLAT